MRPNKEKGGKNRRWGKIDSHYYNGELVFREDRHEYAQVTKLFGCCRREAFCYDGRTRICQIRGKLRKKVWIKHGNIILIGLGDFQDSRADVILKYSDEEARKLKAYGELPETAKLTDSTTVAPDDEHYVVFDDISDPEDDDSDATT
ncbi:eukaryotic translation initiation factor 1A, Y-chromosomal-like [Sycon ciliatum]|uniref:eukaryotic translation initiation factor 1A, Y-chromosomal-like n=1 Tax=Sycon ciliatum TaxID=27933 RepID=UPI0031F61C57